MISREFCTSEDVFNKVNKIPEIGGSTEENKTITDEFNHKFVEYLGENLWDDRASIFNRFI